MKTEAMPTKTEFKFDCPKCGQHILVATDWVGLGISCPSCQTRITIPPTSSDERSAQPAVSPTHTGQTIRIELPIKASQGTPRLNGHAAQSKLDSMVTPTPLAGNEPWPDLVRKLEKGALVEPAALATALFHELMEVRQRLDKLEKRALPEK